MPDMREESFLVAGFLRAMEDIGRYGFTKYDEQSFQARRKAGDTSRLLKRCDPQQLADHAREHFSMYLNHEAHDHFGTGKHQLAAVAFNAMMEFYFAGFDDEPKCHSAPVTDAQTDSAIATFKSVLSGPPVQELFEGELTRDAARRAMRAVVEAQGR